MGGNARALRASAQLWLALRATLKNWFIAMESDGTENVRIAGQEGGHRLQNTNFTMPACKNWFIAMESDCTENVRIAGQEGGHRHLDIFEISCISRAAECWGSREARARVEPGRAAP